jgi:hypothetical protein
MELNDCGAEGSTQAFPACAGSIAAESAGDEDDKTANRVEHWAGLEGTIHAETEQGEIWLFVTESAHEAMTPEAWVEITHDPD